MPEELINFLRQNKIKLNLYKLVFLGKGKNEVYTDDNYIIKVGKQKHLDNEKNILTKLDGLIKAPKCKAFLEYKEDKYILVLEIIKGIAINKIWNTLGGFQKQEIAYSIIEELKKLHNLEVKKDDYIFRKEEERFKIKYKKALNNPDVDKHNLNNYAKEFTNYFDYKGDLVLIHNDLWYKNIIVDEGKFKGFIDFEMAELSLKEAEFFRIKYHLFFAKLEKSKIEIEFLEYLIGEMKKYYQDFTIYDQKIFRIFSIIMYFSLAANYEYSWYEKGDIEAFEKEFLLNLE